MSAESAAAPAPSAAVRLLETIEPTATDKTRYEAGTVWTFPEDTALALVEAGKAELLPDTPAAPAADAAEPATFVGDDDEE